ncbi:MAG: hypothetical protein KGL90_03570 [Burkholderiales bacterium]|nr:hypothetical protein [Burkholderiales bacterium]
MANTRIQKRQGGHKLRYVLIACAILLWSTLSAKAQVSVGIGIGWPGVNIGINLPAYPQLVPVPGYPVYYAPGVNSNYFFYDGLYWVFVDDNWYASSWYNGPWQMMGPEDVPVFVLRVPVRYYRRPPVYFHGWRADAPPRWGEHWGRDWEAGHGDWSRWDRRAAPRPAPLPIYQQHYSGERYPREPQNQQSIRSQHYHYQPHEAVIQQHFQQQQSSPGGSRAESHRHDDEGAKRKGERGGNDRGGRGEERRPDRQ